MDCKGMTFWWNKQFFYYFLIVKFLFNLQFVNITMLCLIIMLTNHRVFAFFRNILKVPLFFYLAVLLSSGSLGAE